jgi:hypothetical protein
MRRQVQRSRNASGESVAAVRRLREKGKKELKKKKLLRERKEVVLSLLRGGLYSSSSRRRGRSAEPLGRKRRARDNHHLTGGERGGVEVGRGPKQLALSANSSLAERMNRQGPIAGGLTKAA